MKYSTNKKWRLWCKSVIGQQLILVIYCKLQRNDKQYVFFSQNGAFERGKIERDFESGPLCE